MDFDPSGIDIMLTYKRGSRSLSHEENITTPRLSWLGPKSEDVVGHAGHRLSPANLSQARHCPISTPPSTSSASSVEVLSSLTVLDRRKAVNLLSRLAKESDGEDLHMDEDEMIRGLQIMLMLNLKAEIQAVDDAGDLTSWLDEKLGDR